MEQATTRKELTRLYHRGMRDYHPDRGANDPEPARALHAFRTELDKKFD
jgi:hypothetical protein